MADVRPPSLFDIEESQRRRDQGTASVIAAAESVTRRSAKAHVIEAIQRRAESGRPFTADDVQRDLPEDIEPHSPNLLPALINGASKRGLIRMHGLARSSRPSRHAGRVCIWIGHTQA